MSDIRTLLEKEAGRVMPPDDLLDGAYRRMRRRRRVRRISAGLVAAVVGVAGLLFAVAAFHRATSAPRPGASQTTVPSSVQPERLLTLCGEEVPNLCVSNPDGTDSRVLLPDLPQWDPAWSPDGTRIAYRGYWRLSEDGADLYVMDADGSNSTRLTFRMIAANPEWSPDGNEIAFDTSGNGAIYVIHPDGTGLRKISGGHDMGIEDQTPTWSPDGTRIAVARFEKGNGSQLFVVDADGSNPRQVADMRGAFSPEWSPDGSRILFQVPLGDSSRLYLVNADGTGLRPLVDGPGGFGQWIDGGARVAFLSTRDGEVSLDVVDTDGTNLHPLITPFRGHEFAWYQPPGRTGSGGSCLSADEPGLISCRQAIEAARQEGSYPDKRPIAGLIDYRAHPGDSPIRAWAMTYPCVELTLPGGPIARSPRGPTYGPWDVVIDAHTGAFKVEGTARGEQSSTPCPPIPGG